MSPKLGVWAEPHELSRASGMIKVHVAEHNVVHAFDVSTESGHDRRHTWADAGVEQQPPAVLLQHITGCALRADKSGVNQGVPKRVHAFGFTVYTRCGMNPILSRSVGSLCQPVVPIGVESSLQLAADRMREMGLPALPVSDGGKILGSLDERDLREALSAGFDPHSAVGSLPLTRLPMLYAGASGAEALRVFEEERVSCAVVVDQQMSLVGMLTPSRLFPHVPRGLRPPLVGGMATPMGVYLTNGAQSGGVGMVALGLTGVFLGVVHIATTLMAEGLGQGLTQLKAPEMVVSGVASVASILLFLVAIRLHPLAGYHAAEHMVVHAIERGEELHPDIVARMPRVHPRCGTNLAAGMGLFFGIAFSEWIPDAELRLLLAVLVTLFFWRSLGSALQYWFTTRPPNRKQLEAGIKAGRELLQRYEANPIVAPSPWSRILSSGLPFILLGYLGLTYTVDFLMRQLGFGGLIGV